MKRNISFGNSICHSSFPIPHSSLLVIRHSSFVIRHSSLEDQRLETLVQEGNHEQQNPETKNRQNPVEPLQRPYIDQEDLQDGEKEERDAKQANRPIAAQNTGDHSRYGIDSPQQRPCELAAVGRLIDKLAHLRFPQCFALECQVEVTQLLAVKSPGLMTYEKDGDAARRQHQQIVQALLPARQP